MSPARPNRRAQTGSNGSKAGRGGPPNRPWRRVHTGLKAAHPPSGRVWINGREIGGTHDRWEHLAASHD